MFHGSSPVGDWSALLERLDRTAAFPRWQRQEAALAAVPCLANLPSRTGQQADRAATDQILGALVRIAAVDGADDADAALVLVHLLRNGILALAARLNRGRPCPRVVSLVVAELTCQIRTFPWRRRTRAYAANLLRDTEHVVLGDLEIGGPARDLEDLLDPFDEAWAVLRRSPARPDSDLDDLLGWAEGNNVAVADDLRILDRLREPIRYGAGGRHLIAAEFGINERTLRRRRDRTLAALRDAAPRFLRDHAAAA